MKKRTDQFEQDLFQMAEQEQMIPPETLYQKAEDTLRHLPKRKHIFRMTWKKSLVLAISAGETEFPKEQIQQETASAAQEGRTKQNPEQELTVPYTGDLAIQKITAGQDCIFLMGKNAVHRMAVGDSDSKLFFDDFDTDTMVSALYEDKLGNVYLALNEQIENTDDQTSGVTIAGKRYHPSLWILQSDGTVTRKVDLASLPLGGDDHISIVRKMVVDEQGYIYLRAAGISDAILIVLDNQGNYVKKITSNLYTAHDMGGLGISRDGKIYTQIQTRDQMGIASVNLENGSLDEIYMDIVPDRR